MLWAVSLCGWHLGGGRAAEESGRGTDQGTGWQHRAVPSPPRAGRVVGNALSVGSAGLAGGKAACGQDHAVTWEEGECRVLPSGGRVRSCMSQDRLSQGWARDGWHSPGSGWRAEV